MALLFFLLLASSGAELYNVDGVGTPSGSPMMKQWAFSYSLLKSDTALSFAPVAGDTAFNTLQSKCRKNFVTDFILSDINWMIASSLNYSMVVVPFFSTALVIPYNVPEIAAAGGRLTLTRELLFQIFIENITTWNDPRIIAENSAMSGILPNKTIKLTVRGDNCGVTTNLASLLFNVDNKTHRADPTFPNWKEAYYNFRNHTFKNATFTQSEFHMASTILTTNYSLGYVALVYADQAGLPFALLKNKQNQPVEPTDANLATSMQLALRNNSLPAVTNIVLADQDGPTAYPLPAIVYIAFQKFVDTECVQRREVFKFLNWILTSKAADDQIAGTVGYSAFGEDSRNLILNQLTSIKCQGRPLLEDEFHESASTYLRQAAMSIAAILITVVLIIGVTMGLKRNNRITKAAGLAFASCFLIGCLFNYISIFVWAQVPSTNMICQTRYILVALGYTLLLGSMFAKCWEIRKIFARAQSGDISPFQELPWWKFCQVFFAVISINAILLLALGVADPPKTMVHRINDIDLISVHMCYVYYVKTWAGLEFTYFGSLVLWGGYLAYTTRDIWEKYNYPNESRSILLSIYNLVFCFCILLPLMTVLAGDLEVVFFFVATAIIFPTSFALFMVYGPKILVFLGSSFKGSGGSQGINTKQSKQKESGGQAVPDRLKDDARARYQDEPSRRPKDHRDDVIVEEDEEQRSRHGGGEGRQSPQLTSSASMGAIALSTEWRVLRHPAESIDNSN